MFNQIAEQNLSKRNLFSVKKSDKEEVLKAAWGGNKINYQRRKKKVTADVFLETMWVGK